MFSYTVAKMYHLFLFLSIAYACNTETTTEPPTTPAPSDDVFRISSFQYDLCTPPEHGMGYNLRFCTFNVRVTEDADVDIVVKMIVKTKLTAPLKATVFLQKKFLGIYVTVPCVDNVGSCTYEDLCEYGLTKDRCPPAMEEMKFPCECPIKPGVYNSPIIKLLRRARTDWAPFLQGEYIGNIKIYQGDTVLTCYDIRLKLS